MDIPLAFENNALKKPLSSLLAVTEKLFTVTEKKGNILTVNRRSQTLERLSKNRGWYFRNFFFRKFEKIHFQKKHSFS